MSGLALLLLLASQVSGLHAQGLIVEPGVVVKFGPQAGLTVRSRLTTGQDVVFTSVEDDAVGGSTGETPVAAQPGDWRGLRINNSVAADGLQLRGLELRYAETALDIRGATRQLQLLKITDSLIGIDVSEAATAYFTGIILHGNDMGLQSRQASDVSIGNSDISGNGYGILNLSPDHIVQATGNWWGDASGPQAPDNPGGTGDKVSAGVDYGQYRNDIPLLGCSVATSDGHYTVSLPDVRVALACRNAVEYRLSATPDFTGIPYQPMTGTAVFTLLPPPGDKQIHAEYRAATGNTVVVSLPQPVHYDPDAPVVSLVQPLAGATITTDVMIVADASAAVGIDRVEFFVGGQLIGTRQQAPYQQTWRIDGYAAGDYSLRVVAYSMAAESAQDSLQVHLQPGTVDPAAPSIDNVRFAGVPLVSGSSLTHPGALGFDVSAPSGISQVSVSIDGTAVAGSLSGGHYSAWLGFAAVANGAHVLTIRAVNEVGIDTVTSFNVTVALDVPVAPTLLTPADGSSVDQPVVSVTGSAQPGSTVHVYLGGTAVGNGVEATDSGSFATAVTLPGLGSYRLAAEASNSRGTSPRSATHSVTYAATPPQLSFVAPHKDAIIKSDTDVTVAIVDSIGIDKVQLQLDGTSVATLTSPPWSWHWDLAGTSNGAHTLRAKAINFAGLSALASIGVTVQKIPPPPPPVPTPYVGDLVSVSPASSYGEQPISIEGRALDRESRAPVANVTLQVLLEVDGFKRTINVATNEAGAFSYDFLPAPSDAGTFRVSVKHPDQRDNPWQGQFTIDRVALSPTSYNLQAARTVTASIPLTVHVSHGSGVSGFRFEATPAAQPSGSLPPGVQITVPDPVDLVAGTDRTFQIDFLADGTAAASGTVVLVAYAASSGTAVRGRVTIHYELSAPVPALVPHPTSLQSGLSQGQQVTLTAHVKNQGLLSAHGLRVELRAAGGTGPAPAWLHLTTAAQLETLPVGESWPIQVTAMPGSSVSEGVYQARLKVSASNAAGGTIPVAIAVTQSGQGDARFHVSDIYTATLDENGNPILGVQGARISLQHETIPNLNFEASSNAQGVALFSDVPAGHYIWRAGAADHNDQQGLIEIHPGVINKEEVFLDKSLVTIEWEVHETTIEDEYEVVVEATYQTQVPAPVVVIEPAFINLPPLQQGEIYSGTLTISNYGLVRADNVTFTPPGDDAYLDYEFSGTVPESLEARERVTLHYKIIAKKPLVTGQTVAMNASVAALRQGPERLMSRARTGGVCQTYRASASLQYEFKCANGATSDGSAGTGWGRTWGGQCGSSGPGDSSGGNDGGYAGGWDGPGGLHLPSTPLSGAPGCTPNCKECCTTGDAPGGG